jgi:peptidoglycan biosynthesis protein MviN/MurJ (putative lipid II flippase)
MFAWLKSFKGTGALIVAVAVVAILLIAFPPYRLFFLISIAIGAVIAGVLQLWHRITPAKIEESENKRPLGLD